MINITMKSNGFNKQINGVIGSYLSKIGSIMQHACEIAKLTADTIYSMQNAGGPTNKPSVSVIKTDDYHYTVEASGNSVCFLEFGAGTMAGMGGGYTATAPVPTTPGSYSATHAQQFVNNGRWNWNGVTYTFIAPTRAMFNAMQDAIKTIEKDIAGGVK